MKEAQITKTIKAFETALKQANSQVRALGKERRTLNTMDEIRSETMHQIAANMTDFINIDITVGATNFKVPVSISYDGDSKSFTYNITPDKNAIQLLRNDIEQISLHNLKSAQSNLTAAHKQMIETEVERAFAEIPNQIQDLENKLDTIKDQMFSYFGEIDSIVDSADKNREKNKVIATAKKITVALLSCCICVVAIVALVSSIMFIANISGINSLDSITKATFNYISSFMEPEADNVMKKSSGFLNEVASTQIGLVGGYNMFNLASLIYAKISDYLSLNLEQDAKEMTKMLTSTMSTLQGELDTLQSKVKGTEENINEIFNNIHSHVILH